MSKADYVNECIFAPFFLEFSKNYCQIFKIAFNIVLSKFTSDDLKNFTLNCFPIFL